MKKVLLLMVAVMLIVGLMAGPALAVQPGNPNALGELRSEGAGADWSLEWRTNVVHEANGDGFYWGKTDETYSSTGQFVKAWLDHEDHGDFNF